MYKRNGIGSGNGISFVHSSNRFLSIYFYWVYKQIDAPPLFYQNSPWDTRAHWFDIVCSTIIIISKNDAQHGSHLAICVEFIIESSVWSMIYSITSCDGSIRNNIHRFFSMKCNWNCCDYTVYSTIHGSDTELGMPRLKT